MNARDTCPCKYSYDVGWWAYVLNKCILCAQYSYERNGGDGVRPVVT